MRLHPARAAGLLRAPWTPAWAKDELSRRARAVPSLDLRFAENKSLVDSVSGQNLITFTRASTGTYVDSDGVIRSAATNLLLRSEEFNDAAWLIFGSASRSANATTAPNGTTTADSITLPGGSGIYQGVTGAPNLTYTFSVWLRCDSEQTLRLVINTNLFDATVRTINVTTQWQRFSITKTTSAGTNFITPQLDTGGGNTFFVWGAQLEVGSTATPYIPTGATINSAPRFDHNPLTGECLGLLVEEQRQNLLLRSEEFDTTWLATSTTITSNSDTAPNGTLTADKLTWGALQTAETYQTITLTTATHTFSIWAKTASGTKKFRLKYYNGTSDLFSSEQTATTEWQRFSYTFTGAAAAGNVSVRNSSPAQAGDLIVWGAQLEVGAFPTSYIPTTGTAATRTADIASISGTNFSSWYRQDEGCVFVAYDQPAVGGSIAVIDDGTTNNTIALFSVSAANQRISSNMLIASANQGRIDAGGTFAANTINKAALAASASGRGLSCNGSDVVTSANPTSMPTLNRLLIQGDSVFTIQKGGHISRFIYWPQRLPNNVLQSITQ